MLGSSVVEAGRALQHEPHLAPYDPHQTDQQVPIGSDLGFIDRHEVDHFAHPVRCHEPRDQDGGVGEVQLLGHIFLAVGCDPESSALVPIEQRGEHAGRVESGEAEPIDRPVGCDEGRGLQVADQSVLGDERVPIHPKASSVEVARRR